jgi:DNA-directed RNA polymerase subunit N (RpoN/RPB10)
MIAVRCASCGFVAVVGWMYYQGLVDEVAHRSPYSFRQVWWPMECCGHWMRPDR